MTDNQLYLIRYYTTSEKPNRMHLIKTLAKEISQASPAVASEMQELLFLLVSLSDATVEQLDLSKAPADPPPEFL